MEDLNENQNKHFQKRYDQKQTEFLTKKINGYTFDWINNGLHKYSGKDTGVIAQEIQSTKLPGITIERPNGYLGVKYCM